MDATLLLLEQLIARASVTPDDAGCQALIAQRLEALGFACEHLPFGPDDGRVDNLWAVRTGARPGPTLVLAGHTDVVPTGPLDQWHSAPFVPTLPRRQAVRPRRRRHEDLAGRDGGGRRGVRRRRIPHHAGRLAFLLTSDEEGPSVDGTVRVVDTLQARGERLDCCIVGEPTCVDTLGDMIKNGRRGSLSARLTVLGVQGHVAYPHLARNPIHVAAPAHRRARRHAVGRRQRPLPAHQLPDLQPALGHRRHQRHPGRGGDRPQLPLLHRVDAGVAEGARRRDPEPPRRRAPHRLDAGRLALPHAARHAERGAGAGDPRRDATMPAARSRPSCPPPAARPTAASSPASARRWSSSARSTPRSTRSTNTWRSTPCRA